MKIRGRISISRITSTEPRGSWVRITLEDETSHVRFADVDIDFERFGQVITGASDLSCVMELRDLDLLGKKHEHKKELIPVPKDLDRKHDDDEAVDEVFAKYEIDGWTANRRDIQNHHNYRGSHSHLTDHDCYEVLFFRYV